MKLKDFLRSKEGISPTAYVDEAGNPTVGVGANLRSPEIPSILKDLGTSKEEVLSGRQISSQEAEKILDAQIDEKAKYFDKIRQRDFPKAQLNPDQQTAISSLMFNNPKLIGPNMRRLLNENDVEGITREIMLRSNASGSPGIQLRRLEEAKKFLGEEGFNRLAPNLAPEERELIRSRIDAIRNEEHRNKAKARFRKLFGEPE